MKPKLTDFKELIAATRFTIKATGVKLEESFYHQKDVTRVARGLLGKELFTKIKGKISSGIIVETEAYSHTEKGCHAYLNKMTKRNEVMFRTGGFAYVYLCYGIHHLFNVVTNREGIGDAVLIRALEPKEGLPIMQRRTGQQDPYRITSGPGKLTKALGIDRGFNAKYLLGDDVWIDEGESVGIRKIKASPRIGIDYAGEDAELPWRYTIIGNKWVSRK